MTAKLWISGRVCRVIVCDAEGRVIDCSEEWNNRASAESWLYDAYPEVSAKFFDRTKTKELDDEWNRCVKGA